MRKILIPPVLVLLSLILIILFYFLFPDLNLISFPFNLIGLLFIFIGIHISGQAHDLLKKYKTHKTYEKPVKLIDEGIYKRTRNPMYLGMFCLLLGIAICFQNILAIFVPFIFILVINLLFILLEEKIMLDAFGDDYIEYKNKVRKWL